MIADIATVVRGLAAWRRGRSHGGVRVAPAVAMASVILLGGAGQGHGAGDVLFPIVDPRPAIGAKLLGAYGYDPVSDSMFITTQGGDASAPGNPTVLKVTGVSGPSQAFQVMVSQAQVQLYYGDGNPNRGTPVPAPGGILLNPKAIGTTPAYGMALLTDGERTTVPGGSQLDPAASKRLYSYNLQAPGPGQDGRDVFTTRVSFAAMQAAVSGSSESSNVQRQFAWSGDGQSVYFADSSVGYSGLWKAGAVSGGPVRLFADDDMTAEPGVRTAGGVDTIFLTGGASTGNTGGIDFVTHNGTATSARTVAVSAATLRDFFEVSANMSSQRIASFAVTGSDLYFLFYNNASSSKPEFRIPGIYRYDAAGRISKVVNKTERSSAVPGANLVFDRAQSRTIAYTGSTSTFDVTQILYRESGANTVAGAIAFKPGDFNRDNAVTAADVSLFKPQVTIRGAVKTNVDDLKYDFNGNDTVDWKDVQIFQNFLGYAADPALAGRIVPDLPIEADADMNGVVDFSDFLVMRANYGAASQGFAQGDFNGDNQVDFADLQPWVNSYGFRSGVVGGGVPMAAFDTAVWNQFLGGLTAPAVTLDVASGRQTQFQKGYRAIVIAASVAKTGTGTLVMDGPNTYTGQTNVAAGTLEIANPLALATSTLQLASGATATVAPYLATTVKGLDLSAGGRLDVGNGMVTVTSGLSAADMVAAIVMGQSGASGITSSAVAAANAAGTPRAIGWLDNGDGSVTFAFAAPGDTNLDGQIDVLDAASLSGAARFNDTAVWSEGDFNYDGIYDDLDNALYVSTGLFDAGPYNAPPGAAGVIAPVPEPAPGAWGLAGLAAAGFIWRGRRVAGTPRGVMRRPAA